MALTLAIIKPDAVAAGNGGKIIADLETAGFSVRGVRKMQLTEEQAKLFYAVHAERPFYGDLVTFMTSGPVMPMALEIDGDAVKAWRDLMGATDSTKAEEGTLRNKYGTDIERNAVHGSDSEENARKELAFFFAGCDLVPANG
ncbi:MAG: nucleoside-diphosphate kinase [Acidobacteriota bacterium]